MELFARPQLESAVFYFSNSLPLTFLLISLGLPDSFPSLLEKLAGYMEADKSVFIFKKPQDGSRWIKNKPLKK